MVDSHPKIETPNEKKARTANDPVKLTWTCAETGEQHEFEFVSAYAAVCWSMQNVMTHDEVKRARNQCDVYLAKNLDLFRERQRAKQRGEMKTAAS